MSYEIGFYVDPYHSNVPKRVTHIVKENGWAVCGHFYRGVFVPELTRRDLNSVQCKTCQRWLRKNATRIATGGFH